MLNRRWLYYAAFGVALTLAFPALGQDAVQPADRPSQEEEAGDSGENQQQALDSHSRVLQLVGEDGAAAAISACGPRTVKG